MNRITKEASKGEVGSESWEDAGERKEVHGDSKANEKVGNIEAERTFVLEDFFLVESLELIAISNRDRMHNDTLRPQPYQISNMNAN